MPPLSHVPRFGSARFRRGGAGKGRKVCGNHVLHRVSPELARSATLRSGPEWERTVPAPGWQIAVSLCDTLGAPLHARPGWRNWQTQRTQNPPSFGSWGFDPPSRHQTKASKFNRLRDPISVISLRAFLAAGGRCMFGVVSPATSCDLRLGKSVSDPVNYRLLVFRRELCVPRGLTHRLVPGGLFDFDRRRSGHLAMSRMFGVDRAP